MLRAALTIVLLLSACGSDEPAAAVGRGPGRGPGGGAAPPPSSTTTPIGRHDYRVLSGSIPTARILPSAPSAPSAAPAAAPARERDLGAELAAAIGSPATCLDLATARALHGRVTIQVSATVTPAGSVTRATASGGGLPAVAIECVRGRALGAHLAPPIEGAPRTVSTALAFEVTATDDATTHETPAWHQPGAVAQPGIVLPAVGADGRPAGALAPDSVLPAVGAQGRPEGSVQPDLVLPARGGGGTIGPSNP